MPLAYSDEAIATLNQIADRATAGDYHCQRLDDRLWDALERLEQHPESHRIGATQYRDPTRWVRKIVVDGDEWLLAWQRTASGTIRTITVAKLATS